MKTTAKKAVAATASTTKRSVISLRDRVAQQIARLAQRVEGLAAKTEPTVATTVASSLELAATSLRNAENEMRGQDVGFRFSKRANGGGPLAEGDSVAIREKRREPYEGFLDAAEMEGLTVVKVLGNRVKVVTAAGTALLLQRGHVQREAKK